MIERTKDWELIKRIVTHTTVYPKVTDDKSPCAACWQPIKDEKMYYLLAKNGIDVLGLFAVSPENSVCYKVHTCLLPHSYGDKATQAAKELIEWVFTNLDCKRLITEVPQFNKLALRFAERAGMTQYGYNPASYLKDGKLQGMTLLGISKETPCP
jgi:hypothetical protein